jgi:hypothetical protein
MQARWTIRHGVYQKLHRATRLFHGGSVVVRHRLADPAAADAQSSGTLVSFSLMSLHTPGNTVIPHFRWYGNGTLRSGLVATPKHNRRDGRQS